MRLQFRPFVGLSIATAIAFAVLAGLGIWQIERLHWKLDLIASVNRNLASAPISLRQAMAMGANGAQYHRVVLEGVFANDKTAYVFATDEANGDPVLHVLVPFRTGQGTLMVDRGIIPFSVSNHPQSEITGATRVVGVWRIPDAPGLFTPAPDLPHRIWYSRDVAAIARSDHVSLVMPVLLEADSTPNRRGWPKGGQTQVHFRNEHLQYAITWFALAAGLLAIYFAYHRARGRLRFE